MLSASIHWLRGIESDRMPSARFRLAADGSCGCGAGRMARVLRRDWLWLIRDLKIDVRRIHYNLHASLGHPAEISATTARCPALCQSAAQVQPSSCTSLLFLRVLRSRCASAAPLRATQLRVQANGSSADPDTLDG